MEPDAALAPSDAVELSPARAVADAVLFEGYLLYPYRASSSKNQVRWQFGVLFPRDWAEVEASEAWSTQTEILLEPRDDARLHLVVRCLQLQSRTVQEAVGDDFRSVPSMTVDGTQLLTWDEGTVQEVGTTIAVADLAAGEQVFPFELPAERLVEEVRDDAGRSVGRIVRERQQVNGQVRVLTERVPVPYDVLKLRLHVENVTPLAQHSSQRDDALHTALIAAHTLIAVSAGAFISLLEPPEWAAAAIAECSNVGSFPVLVGKAGRRDLVLASPIILYDYPEIAPESPGELFDGTEIDEILTLRTLTLTDEEKREARATDPRAAAIIDRADTMPAEIWERLHGAMRSVRPDAEPTAQPWWDPGADASVSPETDSVQVGAVKVSRGSRVLLAPAGRTDAQDMFLAGREAKVAAVLFDVDENVHLAVTLVDDPAAELQNAVGRYRYFSPDEVVPLEEPA